MYTINTEADETRFRQYAQQRDEIRMVIGTKIYPNLVKALASYAALDETLHDESLRAYHDKLMGPITPYIKDLRELAAGIIAIIDAIDDASPGTFGSARPLPPPPSAKGTL